MSDVTQTGAAAVVDGHVHALPPVVMAAFREWLTTSGTHDEGPVHLWEAPVFEQPELQLAALERTGIDAAILTFSSNAPAALHAAAVKAGRRGPDMVRYVNDCLAYWARTSGGRLFPTAWIEPRFGSAALAELERAARQLQMPAISMLTAYGTPGEPLRFLDHPTFWPMLELAAQLNVPIFVHASGKFSLGSSCEPALEGMAATYLKGSLAMLLESTLCLARLAVSGVFERLPNLRLVMGQLGGLFPFVLGRFDLIYDLIVAGAPAHTGSSAPEGGRMRGMFRRLRDYAGQIYVDTHSMDRAALLCAIEALGPERMLFGSDYPVTPEHLGRRTGLETLRTLPISSTARETILGRTALNLLGFAD